MKRGLLLLLGFLFGFNQVSTASHYIGSEISYYQLAPNSYQVTLRLYRDCIHTGIPTPVINVSAPGCNAGRNLLLSLVSVKLNKPYNSFVPLPCGGNATLPNYEIATYSGTLNFSAAESACSDWVLSWSECCRQPTINLVGQDNVYTEAKLKILPGLVNSSPAFDTLHAPGIIASYGVPYNLSLSAIDPDGDSLVYTSVAPLAAANTPVLYQAYPQAGNPSTNPPNIIVNPISVPPYTYPFTHQMAQLPGNPPVLFSPTLPIPSVYVNWSGPPTIPMPGAPVQPMIWAASYHFELNPLHGELKFMPAWYIPGTTLASGQNKYAIAVLVEEYRRINGVMTKLGSTRRETMIHVVDSPNNNPQVVIKQANNQSIAAGYEIQLRPGTPLTLNFAGTDLDNNTVTVSSNATYVLPGATFSATSGNNPAGTITWTPTAAHARWQPYYFHVNLRDDASPLLGLRTETFAVRVSATGGVTGIKNYDDVASGFSAYPNPFSEELTFNLNLQNKAESILIYNLLGQKVDEIPLKTVGISAQKVPWKNAGKYAAGAYVARLISADKTVQTLKFTKLK